MFANEPAARLRRDFHPLRMERWAFSDLNPWFAWLGPAAEWTKQHRQPVEKDQPLRKAEGAVAEVVSASLDYYRDLRDAISEAMFFQTFGNMFQIYLQDKPEVQKAASPPTAELREQPVVREALESIDKGGYAEAVSRVGFLLGRKDHPLPLARLHIAQELMNEYQELLPRVDPGQRRRIRGQQEIICRYEPQRALDTLPQLLADPADRRRFELLLERLLADPRFIPDTVTPEQISMLSRIRSILGGPGPDVPVEAAFSAA
jgi:hypothetical protein